MSLSCLSPLTFVGDPDKETNSDSQFFGHRETGRFLLAIFLNFSGNNQRILVKKIRHV